MGQWCMYPVMNDQGSACVPTLMSLTLVDWSSKVFSLGSTMECSWMYVHVRVLPIICGRTTQGVES